ncbi:GrpB family protein [Arthrobacter roseus]|uniref:GrpB family protein n=1 Tax=Arthrobacter roseus TaxID=136274 RepID=UPI0019668C8F|nr:GrpB family protein [Arthrobacter roseus]MBM7848098.1 GrpB-like predicted nucleotidyltransferase (UPF0157 family) [Arthrobacter roseus]
MPSIFDLQLVRIERALGNEALSIEHAGSTSVPGLAAKPIIDILATVADITAEEDYLNPLLKAGYELRDEPADRELYARTKRELLTHDWTDMNAYAAAKTEVIEGMLSRAGAALFRATT